MELPSEEGEMPIPLNSSYGHGHMMHHHQEHHHHHHPTPPSSHSLIIPSPAAAAAVDDDHHHLPFKKPTRYRECLKNHAAAMGGNATDGCGEFMPSGEDGTLEALTCSACNCHRNFHRKETDGEPASCDNCYVNPRMGGGRKLFVGHHNALGYHHHAGALISSRAVAPHPMLMSYNMGGGGGSDQSADEHDGGGAAARAPHQAAKKRFRTKFTAEQKEKMLNFAEKVGWKIQKQEEAVVQQFCQEVGVKRRVLKVWMHNNKHNLAKKTQSDDQV